MTAKALIAELKRERSAAAKLFAAVRVDPLFDAADLQAVHQLAQQSVAVETILRQRLGASTRRGAHRPTPPAVDTSPPPAAAAQSEEP